MTLSRVKFITIEDLLEMSANNKMFKLVEVLLEDYKSGHIPGAICLPLDQLGALARQHLRKTDLIVVYCASYQCHASTNAAKALLKMGYRKTVDFKLARKVGFTVASSWRDN